MIFFYSHLKTKYNVFSNFHLCNFEDENKQKYCCTEQYFMAMKALIFKDEEMYKEIMNSKSPTYIKKCGRKVKNFDQIKWDSSRYDIMYKACLFKFSQNKELKELLLSTEDKMIFEASPRDKIWGIGLSEDKAKLTDPKKHPGSNLLGKILMEIRVLLKT